MMNDSAVIFAISLPLAGYLHPAGVLHLRMSLQVSVERRDLLRVLVYVLELDLAPGDLAEDHAAVLVDDGSVGSLGAIREAHADGRVPWPAVDDDLVRLRLQ